MYEFIISSLIIKHKLVIIHICEYLCTLPPSITALWKLAPFIGLERKKTGRKRGQIMASSPILRRAEDVEQCFHFSSFSNDASDWDSTVKLYGPQSSSYFLFVFVLF